MLRLANSTWTLTFCVATTVWAGFASAQTVAVSASPEILGKEIRKYAERSGAPGTPEYSAALRQAIAAAAATLHDMSAPNDPNRTVDLSTPPQNVKATLAVDHDARYAKWLEAMADHPLASLKIEGCGPMEVRVIGGETLRNPHCFPEVSLMFGSPSENFCSGVLVNDQHTILTAGHCLCSGTIEYAVFGPAQQDVKAYRVAVARQKGHDGIKCPGGNVSQSESSASLAGQDIAVVQLAKDVPAEVANFVPLPKPAQAQELFAGGNKNLVVVGFGYTDLAPGTPILLQDPKQKTLAVTGILSPDCSGSQSGKADSALYGCAAGQEILAVDGRPAGPCFGDSGGGGYMLVDQPGSGNKLATLVGITSRSTTANCGDGAIYTSLSPEIISWIKNAITAKR